VTVTVARHRDHIRQPNFNHCWASSTLTVISGLRQSAEVIDQHDVAVYIANL
jgi:hypothetical protein